MPLTNDREVKFYTSQELVELPVDDNVTIYKGAFVGLNSSTGYARPLSAGDAFVGVAYARADNTGPGHTAGGINVRLHQHVDIVHAVTGVSVADIGKTVYASADNALTLTAVNNMPLGTISAIEGTNLARVRCGPVTTPGAGSGNFSTVGIFDQNVSLTPHQVNKVVVVSNSVPRTLTLPAASAAGAGAWCRVLKSNNNAATLTIQGNAAETINGSNTYTGLDAQYDSVLLYCTGSEWYILSRDLA